MWKHSFRSECSTSLWYAMRQMRVEKNGSKILELTEGKQGFYRGEPHQVGYELYYRYLRRFKPLCADLGEVNAKIRDRTRTNGNFFIQPYEGFGYVNVEAWEKSFHPYREIYENTEMSLSEYRYITRIAVERREKLMQTKKFKKLVGEARTIAILIAENEGVLYGKARISRK